MRLKIYRIGVEEEEKVLRKKAKPLQRVDTAVQKFVADMFETMYEAPGVGLAAPQVGRSRRIIVVDVGEDPIALINPVIKKFEGEEWDTEGCLSVPGKAGEVCRAKRVEVEGYDLKGKKVRIKAEGFQARALQHEIDHLDGTLYIDKAEDIKDV